MFVVRCPAPLFQILRFAQKDIPCHHKRSRRRSEGSGVPHWSSPLAATGDFKGDMHPDDASVRSGCYFEQIVLFFEQIVLFCVRMSM